MGSHSSKPDSEFEIESAIGVLLRYGVIVSSVIIAIAVILMPFKIGTYSGTPPSLDEAFKTNYGATVLSIGSLFKGLASLNPLSVAEIGVIVLLAIPLFRVAAGGLMFAYERDWKYVLISSLVLGVLLFATFIIGPFEARR